MCSKRLNEQRESFRAFNIRLALLQGLNGVLAPKRHFSRHLVLFAIRSSLRGKLPERMTVQDTEYQNIPYPMWPWNIQWRKTTFAKCLACCLQFCMYPLVVRRTRTRCFQESIQHDAAHMHNTHSHNRRISPRASVRMWRIEGFKTSSTTCTAWLCPCSFRLPL